MTTPQAKTLQIFLSTLAQQEGSKAIVTDLGIMQQGFTAKVLIKVG